MSNKVKSTNSSKKLQNSLPMKEIIQQNQLSNELLKIIVARSEDIVILKSISDRKTGKLRLQSAFAEKSLQEIESKEDWRLMREDQILSQLTSSRVEAALHKKQFEKLIRKMMKVSTQIEDDPNDHEMNLTEINVQKIMNIKIGPENTFITYNPKGQPLVTVPSGLISASSWRDNYAKSHKIIECLLSGETLNIYPAAYFCTRYSRSNIGQEISRQKLALEQGNTYLSPNIAVIITSKKSKASINLQKSPSPVRKIVSVPEPDYKTPLFNFYFDLNSELHKKIKDFKLTFAERSKENRTSKQADMIEKALRIRNYEKCSAVKPSGFSTRISLNTVRTRGHLTAMPQIVFDLDNPYFEESKTLADRVKVIHFCIAVQKRFRYKRNQRLSVKAVIIQRHFRGFIVRKKIFLQKIQKFRKMFHWSRLKHWYPLLVNTFRERKSDFVLMDYALFLDSIIKIQKNIRGALVRKIVIKWKQQLACLNKNKAPLKLHQKKLATWGVSLAPETDALSFSQKSEDEIREIMNNVKNDEKALPIEAVKSSEKNEAELRKVLMARAKFERLKVFE